MASCRAAAFALMIAWTAFILAWRATWSATGNALTNAWAVFTSACNLLPSAVVTAVVALVNANAAACNVTIVVSAAVKTAKFVTIPCWIVLNTVYALLAAEIAAASFIVIGFGNAPIWVVTTSAVAWSVASWATSVIKLPCAVVIAAVAVSTCAWVFAVVITLAVTTVWYVVQLVGV